MPLSIIDVMYLFLSFLFRVKGGYSETTLSLCMRVCIFHCAHSRMNIVRVFFLLTVYRYTMCKHKSRWPCSRRSARVDGNRSTVYFVTEQPYRVTFWGVFHLDVSCWPPSCNVAKAACMSMGGNRICQHMADRGR